MVGGHVPDEEEERARRLNTEPAQRILAAARRLVGQRGIERSHVVDIAREAGVARGLVNYYFGTKDRLLAEVMEADASARLQRLHELLDAADTLDELLEGMRANLSNFLSLEQGAHLALQELGTLALRNDEIRARRARLRATHRQALAEILVEKETRGIVVLRDGAEIVAAVLIALGQGIATETLADPDWDSTRAVACALDLVRRLLEP